MSYHKSCGFPWSWRICSKPDLKTICLFVIAALLGECASIIKCSFTKIHQFHTILSRKASWQPWCTLTSIKLYSKRHPFHRWYWHQYALEMEHVTSPLGFSSQMQCKAMQCNPMRFKTLSSGCSCCKSISTNNRREPGYWHPHLGQWKTRPWNFKSSKNCDNWQMCENAFGSFVKAVIREFQWVRICQSVEYNQL